MTTDENVHVLAIMTPHPGKMDRCIEVLTQATHMVKENEPGNLRYHLHVETNGEDRGESLVFLETYDAVKTLNRAAHG
ncbi:MAG: hypothetical protein Q9178_005281 [Gyalolechia marmorata]